MGKIFPNPPNTRADFLYKCRLMERHSELETEDERTIRLTANLQHDPILADKSLLRSWWQKHESRHSFIKYKILSSLLKTKLTCWTINLNINM